MPFLNEKNLVEPRNGPRPSRRFLMDQWNHGEISLADMLGELLRDPWGDDGDEPANGDVQQQAESTEPIGAAQPQDILHQIG